MKARLLVVDDDPMMLELLVTRLELAGYAVATARDGVEALRRLHEYRPHGVILDINMPRLDGFGVLEQMNTGRWPVLVLTARNQTPDVQRAISLGARDFLSKPFKDNQLLLRVARLLRKTGAGTDAVVI